MIKRLLYMRHGESEVNAAHIYGGSQPHIQLTELGRAQAALAAEHFTLGPVDTMFASNLDRAQDTAKIMAAGIGFDPSAIITDERIREINVGHLTGQPDQGFVAGYAHIAAGTDPTAETPEQVMARVRDFLRDLLASPALDGQTVLVVAHAGIARAFRAALTGVTLESIAATNIPNAEVFEIPLELSQEQL